MLLELILAGALGPIIIDTVIGRIRAYRESLRETTVQPFTSLEHFASTEAQLIAELVKSGEGWTSVSNMGLRTFTHDTGVKLRINEDSFGGDLILSASILDENRKWQSVKLDRIDRVRIADEYSSYIAREETRKRDKLARTLAERVLARERGEVCSVLGEPGLPPSRDDLDDGDSGRTEDVADTSRLLSYDPTTNTIVASVRGSDVTLNLDASLRARYGLHPTKPGLMRIYQ